MPKSIVGFSGGMDSVCLLHQMRNMPNLLAVHVHHNLHPFADSWVQFCTNFCKNHNIPLKVEYVHPNASEKDAREKRYAALAQHMQEGDTLYLAHHKNDDVETQLMGLIRGAHKHLAGIPSTRPFAAGAIKRPLLHKTRTYIHNYCIKNNLEYIEDPANTNPKYLRSALRPIVAQLVSEYPSVGDAVKTDLNAVFTLANKAIEALGTEKLSVETLKTLPAEYILNIFSNHQFDRCGINEFWRQAKTAAHYKKVRLDGPNGTLSRHKGYIYFHKNGETPNNLS